MPSGKGPTTFDLFRDIDHQRVPQRLYISNVLIILPCAALYINNRFRLCSAKRKYVLCLVLSVPFPETGANSVHLLCGPCSDNQLTTSEGLDKSDKREGFQAF